MGHNDFCFVALSSFCHQNSTHWPGKIYDSVALLATSFWFLVKSTLLSLEFNPLAWKNLWFGCPISNIPLFPCQGTHLYVLIHIFNTSASFRSRGWWGKSNVHRCWGHIQAAETSTNSRKVLCCYLYINIISSLSSLLLLIPWMMQVWIEWSWCFGKRSLCESIQHWSSIKAFAWSCFDDGGNEVLFVSSGLSVILLDIILVRLN